MPVTFRLDRVTLKPMLSNWRKSSYSFANGNCVEAAAYRKSSHSQRSDCVEAASWRSSAACASGECVEAGNGDGGVGVRDSALQGSPVLEFTAAAWRELTERLKRAGR